LDLNLLTTSTILLFLLMLVRISGMMVAAPFFSQMGVPTQLKVGIAVTLTLILFPLYSAKAHIPTSDLWGFSWIVGQEFVIGMLLGFVANMLFSAVQMAGYHVTTQMGLGIAQVVDPISQEQAPIMAQFYFILAILLFMSLNIHHSLIVAVAKSFEMIPLSTGFVNFGLITARFMVLAGDLFRLSLMLVMPVIGTMLVLEVALAFMAKIMPQMNIFMVALPLKVGVALILIYLTLPFTLEVLGNAYADLSKHLVVLFQS
jgi:flagellar biosynthesis protein FliR